MEHDLSAVRLARLEILLAETPRRKKRALSARIKKSPAQVSQWLSGYRSISETSAREIETAAQKPRMWMDQPVLDAHPPAESGAPDGGVAQDLSLAPLKVAPTITWEQLMTKPLELPPEFHLVLRDDAMAPRAPAGVKVKFAAGATAQPGDAVLVRDADGQHYFREYRARLGTAWQAHATNPAYPSLLSSDNGLQVVAVFIGIDTPWSALVR